LNQSWNYNETTYWFGSGTFKGHIAGVACGGLWVGPYGLDSLPDVTCMDGSPPGIYLYELVQKNAKKKKRLSPVERIPIANSGLVRRRHQFSSIRSRTRPNM
jgi:hypothetical protein